MYTRNQYVCGILVSLLSSSATQRRPETTFLPGRAMAILILLTNASHLFAIVHAHSPHTIHLITPNGTSCSTFA